VKFIIKKFFIILIFIITLNIFNSSYSYSKNIEDYGIIGIMYHRFEENKYPSTNIKVKDFISHINEIINADLKFITFKEFDVSFGKNNTSGKVLLTVDDAFSSFYKNAWPILKKEKIPFIIFVNTETVGAKGYMNWEQIQKISKFDFVYIGNHSHSHGYLVDKTDEEIRKDLTLAKNILKKKLDYETKIFAYPFGEYKNSYIKIVKDLGFKYAFGQHSGVIDQTKNKFELPRFPINEKYGEIKRFKSLLKNIPFPYKKILPEEKYLADKNNPPDVTINFFEDQKNLESINCYSNEQNKWRKSKLLFTKKNQLKIILDGKFNTERGRINCSLREESGYWRWLGIQFVIADL
tara:strand:- start:3858 stop:4907 length:1050 start_codon:yes stop_codon:yes gene_type:complete